MYDRGFYADKADGIFGPKTSDAVVRFQIFEDLNPDGIVCDETWEALKKSKTDKSDLENIVYDIRGKHSSPKNYSHKRSPRPWWRINGVTLHQTGCNMPSDPNKWSRLNAHVGITKEGKLILVNDFQDFIWHAQGLSHNTIGIEIEGNYYGVEGRKNTLWKGGGGPDKLNASMFIAIRYLLDILSNEFNKNNVEWKYIFAHRQSSNMRTSDPGELIWKTVAKLWAKKLKLGKDWYGGRFYTKGDGLSIPEEWME